MAHWHALAKLRMHHDLTLQVMEAVTKSLGHRLRVFRDKTCAAFATKELRREYNARMRRRTKKAATHTTNGPTEDSLFSSANQTSINLSIPSSHSATDSERQSSTRSDDAARVSVDTHKGRRPKTFRLNTYKAHSLGDYPRIIREYGTTDSFSTEPVG